MRTRAELELVKQKLRAIMEEFADVDTQAWKENSPVWAGALSALQWVLEEETASNSETYDFLSTCLQCTKEERLDVMMPFGAEHKRSI